MSSDWAGGYIADTPYVPTLTAAQTPTHLALVAAMAGVAWQPDRDALTLIDLGCGRGQSIAAMAAANPGWQVVGVDFSPAHIADAREVAAAAGLDNARFLELDLAAIDAAAAAQLLPEADVVSLHGLWTWVSDAVRDGVLAVLAHRLKPGGIAVVSYNSMPGRAGDLALQRLVHDLARRIPGTAAARATRALEIAHDVLRAGAPALEPSIMLKRLTANDAGWSAGLARYLAHEFLTDHWRPAYAADVHRAMATAKLEFVGAASLVRQFPELFLTAPQRDALVALPPGTDRALVEDCFQQPTLRQDVFVRGRRGIDAAAAVRAIRLGLCERPRDGVIKVDVPTGEAALPETLAATLLAALAEGPQRVGDLLARPGLEQTTVGELVLMLVGSGVAAPLWRDPPPPGPARERARRFNRVALARYGPEGAAGRENLALAVPALGAALPSDPAELALALELGGLEPGVALDVPALDVPALARRLLVSEPTPEAIAWAESAVTRVLANRLDAWRTLGVV